MSSTSISASFGRNPNGNPGCIILVGTGNKSNIYIQRLGLSARVRLNHPYIFLDQPIMKLQTALIWVLQNIAAFSFLTTATPVNHIDLLCDSPVWNVGQSVRTTSGLVVGHSAANASEVSEYVGIPYAAPPLGRLRFQPPVHYTGNDTINATALVSYRCMSASSASKWVLIVYLNRTFVKTSFLHRVRHVFSHHQHPQATTPAVNRPRTLAFPPPLPQPSQARYTQLARIV